MTLTDEQRAKNKADCLGQCSTKGTCERHGCAIWDEAGLAAQPAKPAKPAITEERVLELAKEAGGIYSSFLGVTSFSGEELFKFAALIAAEGSRSNDVLATTCRSTRSMRCAKRLESKGLTPEFTARPKAVRWNDGLAPIDLRRKDRTCK